MKSLTQHYTIEAPIEKVWQALINTDLINEWGGGPAEMNDEVDQEFRLWGGDIWGKNIEVVPNRKLVQEWYSGQWPKPSICTFELVEDGDETELTLIHTHIPDDEFNEIENGWKEHYLEPLKNWIEKE